MPRTTTKAVAFARRGLNDIVRLYLSKQRSDYGGYMNNVETREEFYRIATLSDLPPASAINQATGIVYDDVETPWYQDLTPVKRAIGWAISDEALMRDFYNVWKDRNQRLAASITKAIDADCANIWNLGTTTHITTPDGVALFSASHLMSNGFYSNILTGNPPLSISSLELAIQAIMAQPSHMGDPMYLDGPFDLIVPVPLAGLANRLVKAFRQPQNNHNDPNWAGSIIRDVRVVRRLTSATGWGLVSASKDENPLILVNGSPLKTHIGYDQDKDIHKHTATKLWVKGAKDGRAILWSAGTG
jgi:hypothetical protein